MYSRTSYTPFRSSIVHPSTTYNSHRPRQVLTPDTTHTTSQVRMIYTVRSLHTSDQQHTVMYLYTQRLHLYTLSNRRSETARQYIESFHTLMNLSKCSQLLAKDTLHIV